MQQVVWIAAPQQEVNISTEAVQAELDLVVTKDSNR
jgi:hypothetical protein